MSNEETGQPEAVEYDCSPWAGETRRILRSVLLEREIPHAWEGTVLVVPLDFEEEVDEIVDIVAATARSSLGSARSTVGYDVSAWSAASQNRLVELMVDRTVPHEWDAEGDLVVHEEDAEVTEELISELGEPDGAGELDGLVLHDRMGRLFVAADRLARDPHDSSGTRDLDASFADLEHAAVPFGVEAETWLELHRLSAALVAALDGLAEGDEDVRAFEPDGSGPDGSRPEEHDGDGDRSVRVVADSESVQGLRASPARSAAPAGVT